jgi:hypothetical protein
MLCSTALPYLFVQRLLSTTRLPYSTLSHLPTPLISNWASWALVPRPCLAAAPRGYCSDHHSGTSSPRPYPISERRGRCRAPHFEFAATRERGACTSPSSLAHDLSHTATLLLCGVPLPLYQHLPRHKDKSLLPLASVAGLPASKQAPQTSGDRGTAVLRSMSARWDLLAHHVHHSLYGLADSSGPAARRLRQCSQKALVSVPGKDPPRGNGTEPASIKFNRLLGLPSTLTRLRTLAPMKADTILNIIEKKSGCVGRGRG